MRAQCYLGDPDTLGTQASRTPRRAWALIVQTAVPACQCVSALMVPGLAESCGAALSSSPAQCTQALPVCRKPAVETVARTIRQRLGRRGALALHLGHHGSESCLRPASTTGVSCAACASFGPKTGRQRGHDHGNPCPAWPASLTDALQPSLARRVLTATPTPACDLHLLWARVVSRFPPYGEVRAVAHLGHHLGRGVPQVPCSAPQPV